MVLAFAPPPSSSQGASQALISGGKMPQQVSAFPVHPHLGRLLVGRIGDQIEGCTGFQTL